MATRSFDSRDVASVAYGAENDDVRVTFNGEEGTFLGVFTAPGANALDTSTAVRAELPQIQSELPPGMTIELVYDASDNIRGSIEEVFKTISEAVVIVVLVILLFLGSFRSVLVPIFTIPLSLIGVCFILYLFGYSINLLTLLAMVLAIGLVVDDAIVVVENIHRHLEEGEPPIDAAIHGMREIFAAGRRHDHHARRGLRADRLRAGPDRRALPRIRGDAGRRRGHLRLHRGDALADDRGARPEAARGRRRQPLPAHRRPELRPRQRMVRPPRLGDAEIPARHADDRRGALGDDGLPLPEHVERARAGRGHRLHVLDRQRAGLRHRQLHGALHPAT